MRKRFTIALTITMAVSLATLSLADDRSGIKSGFDAYARGDFANALKEWRPLAENCNPVAQTLLGLMSLAGEGGAPRNEAEAAKWFQMAAERGVSDAQYNLGLLYSTGKGVPHDNVQAHAWALIASAQDDEQAMKLRDVTAEFMGAEQIAEAQRRAREWRPKKDGDCLLAEAPRS